MSNRGMTTIEVKKINRRKVYGTIYEEKSICKQEIAAKLNMGLTTVTQNLKALEEDGLIIRTGYYESTGGRKAQALEINKTAKIAVGVFILKHEIFMAAVDLYGEILDGLMVEHDFGACDEYYRFLGNEVSRFIEGFYMEKDRIAGVGIAIQGIVSTDGSHMQYAKLLENYELKSNELTKYIPYKCRLMHDSKAAAFAEIWHNPSVTDAIVFLVNKNLGSALVLNREIHSGKSMCSGTIEHMCIVPEGRQCYCGAFGCLEAYCSADSLKNEIGEISINGFFKAMRGGNEGFIKIWDEYLTHLADAVRNCCTVMDGDIIISGLLTPYFVGADLDILKEKVRSAPFFSDRDITIILGRHGETAPAIGAALPFIKEMIDDIRIS